MSMPLGSSGLGSDGLPISGGGTGAQLFAQKQQDMSETAEQTATEAKAAAERTAAEQAAPKNAKTRPLPRTFDEKSDLELLDGDRDCDNQAESVEFACLAKRD